MSTKEEFKIHILLTDAQRTKVLIRKEHETISLPVITIESDEFWCAHLVKEITDLSSRETGIPLHYLREILDSNDECLCEMEMADDELNSLNTDYSFENICILENLTLKNEIMKKILLDLHSSNFAHHPLRPAWEKHGWHNSTLKKIKQLLKTHQYTLSGTIEKIKAFSGGVILVIPVEKNRKLYFKMSLKKGLNEPTVLKNISPLFPNNVAEVITADYQDGWMLMKEFKAKYLSDLESEELQRKKAAIIAKKLAEMQIELAKDIEKWHKLNTVYLSNSNIYEEFKLLLNNQYLLKSCRDPISDADIQILKDHLPVLKAKLDRLDEYKISYSIVHEDFREGNIAVGGNRIIFYDWADTVISHPFFSINIYLVFMGTPGNVYKYDNTFSHPEDSYRKLVRDAYLKPFKVYETPQRLLEAFELSRELNYFYLALRWYRYSFFYDDSDLHLRYTRDRLREILLYIKHLKWIQPAKANPFVELSAAEMQSFCGEFRCEAENLKRRIYLKDDGLYYWRNENSETKLCPVNQATLVMGSGSAILAFNSNTFTLSSTDGDIVFEQIM